MQQAVNKANSRSLAPHVSGLMVIITITAVASYVTSNASHPVINLLPEVCVAPLAQEKIQPANLVFHK